MSINTILSTAASGMMAAQAGIRTVSDNVANANTPGYVRKVINQTSLVSQGAGAGVNVGAVARVVDRYLQTASLAAGSTAGKSSILSELLDRAQGLFGDPSGSTNFFMNLGEVFSDFATLANDPTSSLSRSQALTSVQSFFDDSARIANSLQQLQQETDTRLKATVNRVNDLLAQITKLNVDVRAAKISGTDSAGSENIQSQLIDELTGLINVQVQTSADGATVLRTQDGFLLADDRSATLAFNQTGNAAGYLTITPGGSAQTFDALFTSGELVGMLQARNEEIPGALAQLSEFSAAAAREINRAHNDSTASPPPLSLTGRNTGLDLPAAVTGFTGITTLALMNGAGVIQNRVQINFNTSQISLNGGAGAAFTPATFLATLNGALGANGSASFANGALTVAATAGGIAISDDAAAPSNKGTQGFSHYFGLNDLVRSTSLPLDTGLVAAANHGFTAGQTATFRLTDPNGVRLRDINFTVPAGTTMANLVTALNAPVSGVSPYGQFVLDGNGRLNFNASVGQPVTLSVVEDLTSRGVGGPSMTALFGLGIGGKAEAAASYSLDTAIYQDPTRLATGRLNLAAVGVAAYAAGDGRGALAISASGELTTSFGRAGGLPAASMALSRYASEVAGSLGRRANAADTAMQSAQAVKVEADARRTSYEGVNTDEELIKLTTYQQAFNASARLIQASNDLYDALFGMVG